MRITDQRNLLAKVDICLNLGHARIFHQEFNPFLNSTSANHKNHRGLHFPPQELREFPIDLASCKIEFAAQYKLADLLLEHALRFKGSIPLLLNTGQRENASGFIDENRHAHNNWILFSTCVTLTRRFGKIKSQRAMTRGTA